MTGLLFKDGLNTRSQLAKSSNRSRLPGSSPLRTVLDSFPSYGSSLYNAPLTRRGIPLSLVFRFSRSRK
jgi:hypothetical protein